jgi:hypothetical protein
MTVTRDNYFDPAVCRAYMSSHRFASWLKCPARQWNKEKGNDPDEFRQYEDEKACYDVGHYVELGVLEPGKLADWTIANADRIISKTGTTKGQPKAEFREADDLIRRATKEPAVQAYLATGVPQAVFIGEIGGHPWKAMADMVCHSAGVFIDIKTAKGFDGEWDAAAGCRVPWYNRYWQQMAIYRHVIRQATAAEGEYGDWEPVIIGLRKATAARPPTVRYVRFSDPARLDAIVGQIAEVMPRVAAHVASETEPPGCGDCWWCDLHLSGRVDEAEWFQPRMKQG